MTLDEYLESRRDDVFAWGVNDCGKFVAGWLGIDTNWTNEEEARAFIQTYGSIPKALDSVLERIPVNHAVEGDIMQAKDDSLGICAGVKVATPTDGGLRFVRRDYYVRAWSCRKQ